MDEDIKKLIDQNIALTTEVLQQLEKVNRYIFWQRVTSVIYLILIITPIILAAFYLPPLLGDMFEQYRDILETLK
jgi:hypothetical protein